MCGVMAEYATMVYLDMKNIRHTCSLMTHLDGFNKKTYADPDFVIRFNGQDRFLEVKSNQLHHNRRFYRMLTPTHWLIYSKNKSMVLWCATDIAKC